MQVKYSYLDQQFSDVDTYFQDLRKLVSTGEFTLGPFVEAFEKKLLPTLVLNMLSVPIRNRRAHSLTQVGVPQ